MKNLIEAEFGAHRETLERTLSELGEAIESVIALVIGALDRDNKILIFGNGGSAADAQHIAAELTGSFNNRARRGLPAIALTTDTSALTSISNDFGYENVFSRQVEALARPGDLLIGISTSGNSQNVVNGLREGSERCTTIGFSGNGGGEMKTLCDENIVVPATETARIQEMHLFIGHIICLAVDNHFS